MESGTAPSAIAEAGPPKRRLSRVPHLRGESRIVILEHEESGGRIAARLVRVEGGGVDRTTGAPLTISFELTVKLPYQAEVTRTFSGQGDPTKAEWNARVAYLASQHGTAHLALPVGEVGARIWPERSNLTALEELAGCLAGVSRPRPRRRALADPHE